MDRLATRLPGVTFRTEVPAPSDVLPRMDVTGFVGLAACGPVGVPVPVEDPGRYRDLFGPALPLAWDAAEGRTATAFLTPAVEAFFRNGGKRCWVVREARGTVTSHFPLPTLLDAATGRPALARARCAGSWADALRAGAVLDARVLNVSAFARSASGVGFALTVRDPEPLVPADVLRVRVRTETRDQVLVLPVLAVHGAAGVRRVTMGPGRTFHKRPPHTGLPVRVRVSVLGSDGAIRGTIPNALLDADGGIHFLYYNPAGRPEVAPGDVLHAVPHTGPLAGQTLWLATGDVEPVVLDDGRRRTRVRAADALWPRDLDGAALDALLAAAQGEGTLTVEKLAFALVVWEGEEVAARLGGLGLAASTAEAGSPERTQTRFWADLPTDEVLFRLEDGQPVPPVAALDRAAFTPRFPLAGPANPATLYVPLGMPVAPSPEAAHPPVEADATTALERDGLAGFSPRWFLDTDLADRGVRALPAAVFDQLYLQPTLSAQRAAWPLRGIHALWPLDDVTLLAAPDAVQPGWVLKASPLPAPLAPPDAPDAEALDAPGGFRIAWDTTNIEEAVFELEASPDPQFAAASVVYRGTATHTHVYFGEETPCGVDLGCLAPRYYRLRLRVGGRLSPWSDTLRLDPAPVGFRACRAPLDAPRLRLIPGGSDFRLRWRAVPGAICYAVEASRDPAFGLSEPLGTVAEPGPPGATAFRRFTVAVLPASPAFYRVRAERDGEAGPWSNTVTFVPSAASRWTMRTPAEYDDDLDGDGHADGAADLLAFHRGALRFCAARADVTALLALPAHYRTDRAAAHVAALTPDPGDDDFDLLPTPGPTRPLSLDEEPALSYGALYHPWLGIRDETARTQPVRFLPPDGAVAGMVAARALARGAWVAPANVALRDVVALEPAFDDVAWARLLYGGLNLVRPLPRGFAPLSAETLAGGVLRPLNVRRLMILLRRLALREGQRFAFDDHSAALRRRLSVHFEGVMTRLFERGAFAGARPLEAFQVRADDAVNPPESVDRGRLLVELRVAPSQPLAFLTVRLVQLDGVGLTTVEA